MITEWETLSIANINAHKAHRGHGALLGLNDFDFEII
ncbi:TPA: hypothetical protein GRR62_04485 [Vibrio parahaemolyticus]|nr:hypothetical protein [Vibrio parahaemolyticus]OQU51747.1 hypothetical protein EM74_001650 [Vibrio parahaemolyticus]HAS6532153.1 hypothetical protein [Vibrio parahaemolyticus]HAS6551746.1 hypothetical protein [Vibrio parahaemolyticus]HAS6556540.1 hypothetical protein [Vibrio parahaemolyticus]